MKGIEVWEYIHKHYGMVSMDSGKQLDKSYGQEALPTVAFNLQQQNT